MRKTIAVLIAITLLFTMPACTLGNDYPGTESASGTTDNNPATTDTVHTHIWEDATCTSPQKCAECGVTEGNALAHSWIDANCTTPKTCSACGETTGSSAPHNFANGKCTICGKDDPSDPNNISVWIPTNGGKKYHSRSNCSNMKNPSNVSLAEAKNAGFTACQRCH